MYRFYKPPTHYHHTDNIMALVSYQVYRWYKTFTRKHKNFNEIVLMSCTVFQR